MMSKPECHNCESVTVLSQTCDSDYLFPISANFLIASPDSIPGRWLISRSNNYKDVGCNSISKSPNDY